MPGPATKMERWFPLVGAGIGAITAGVALAADAFWPALVAVLIDRTESEIDVMTDPRITILRA